MKQILFTAFFLIFAILSAQEPRFKHITIEDGLSQSTINHLFQDNQGFLWIGTQDGLNRYDGYNFKIYRPEPGNKYSINAIDIWSIHQAEADSGRVLWLGTHAGGLNIYDIVSDRFYHFLPNPGDPLYPSAKNILRIHSAIIGTQRIVLLGGQNYGLDILLLKENWYREMQSGRLPWERIYHFENEPDNPESLGQNDIYIFCEDTFNKISQKKTIWIGTYGGGFSKLEITKTSQSEDSHGLNFKIRKMRFTSKEMRSLNNDIVQSIIIEKSIDGKKILWLGTHDGLKKLTLMNNSDDTVINFKIYWHKKNDSRSLPNNEIYALIKDQMGDLWIGTYNGLARMRSRTSNDIEFESFSHNSLIGSSLNENHITRLFEDEAGIIWAGTHGKGLNLYDRKSEKFKHYRNHPASEIRLNDSNIKSIFEDPDDDLLWIGTHNGGLNRVDLKRKTIQYFKKQSANPESLGHNRIIKIFQDRRGLLWLGTYRGGVLKFDKITHTCRQYRYNPEDPTSLSDDDVNSIIEDEQGDLWFGTYGGGINKFDPRTEKFTHFHHNPQDKSSLSNDLVRALLKSNDGKIWIGSEGGLSLLTGSVNKKVSFVNYAHIPGDTSSLSTNHIFCLHEAAVHYPGHIWIGTEGGGINRFNPKTGKFRSYTTKNGLSNDVTYGILEDDGGNLWISTNYGLSKFDPQSEVFTNFTVRDGLQSNEFNFGAYCRRKNGELLFGGINGINAFYPDKINPNTYTAPLVLTNLEILNKPVHTGSGILQKSINMTDKIVLDYSDNIFSLQFASLHMFSPEKNRYSYIMDGFDRNWTSVDASRRIVTYTNLDPGSYIFRVKGTNNDGIWNDKETRLNILILPPFWQTWWFRILAVLTILALLYLLHRYRLARLLEIERLRVRIASDLHDDVGSALTKIALHSEIIQSSDNSEQVKSSSKNIGNMSREIITTMSDIVWSIDARNDKMGNLLDRMRDFAFSVLSLQDIQVKFSSDGLDPEKKIPINYRQNLFLIFKESINNIARHSGATQVAVLLDNTGNEFIMRISDNGHGFDKSSVKSGNGLGNMAMRAKRIGGEITINSGNGVMICLSIKKF
jgi:ligand-binding sensor domain-containing protein/signal transduction histidine kinase